jgi:hypothetical protein
MALTRRSIATLLDLVEIKLSCIEVVDREDHRELKALRACREELLQLIERCQAARGSSAGRQQIPVSAPEVLPAHA